MSDHDPTDLPPPQQQQHDLASPQQQQQQLGRSPRSGRAADGPPTPPPEENLFTPSAIKLFGRTFHGLSVNQPVGGGNPPLGERARIPSAAVQAGLKATQGYEQIPGRLERSLRKVGPFAPEEDNYARFARIYGFAYEGQYYDMPRPVVFLVYGPGVNPETYAKGNGASGAGFTVAGVGVAAKDWSFASDIRMWEVDDKDVSMCLDIESGPMREILLAPIFELEEEMALSGAAASRGAAAGRGAASGRGAAAGRGAAVGRGAAAARGAAITRDPHRSR